MTSPSSPARTTEGRQVRAEERRSGAPAALATEPWVWIDRDISPGYLDEVVTACRQAGFSPDARHHAGSIATQLAMVSCGIGSRSCRPSLHSRSDIAARVLRQSAQLVTLSLLVHDEPDPLVHHFLEIVSATLPMPTRR